MIIIWKNYGEVRKLFQNGNLSQDQAFDLLSCIEFFEKEFYALDQRTLSILKS